MSDQYKNEKRRLYGRRSGRPLGRLKKRAMQELYPSYALSENNLEKKSSLAPSSLFSNRYDHYALEIGFGEGEHLLNLCTNDDTCGFIGAEPFVNGMASLMTATEKHDPQPRNLRVLMDDAIPLVQALTDSCLDKIYVLNPDPWPKVRHHKRRIINQENLDEFARVLKPGGLLVTSTDVADLAEWIVTQGNQSLHFQWTAQSKKDWLTPPAEWIETRYAAKGKRAGRTMRFMIFKRL